MQGEPGGELTIAVIFPSQPAQVAPQNLPQATNSVRIRVLTLNPSDPPTLFWETVIARGTTDEPVEATKSDVPVGWYLVQAFGYASNDGTGQVIAEAETHAEVTAGQTTQVTLITQALIVRVEIQPSALELELQSAVTITASGYDADGNVILGASFDWDLSVADVVQLSDTGVLTALAVGQCTITATETGTGIAGTCAVNVFRRHTAYVLVVPDTYMLHPPTESTVQLAATAYDEDDEVIPYATVTWSSNAETVATVNNEGLVTAVATGSGIHRATITADAGEGIPGTADIAVVPVGGMDIIVRDAD